MSKKDAKVSEAQLPPPPLVTEFIKTLKEWKDKKQDAPARSNMFETQRYNILIFGNRLGFRADTLEHLLTTTFEQGSDAQGKYLVPKIGTMKNRQR